MDDYLYSGVMYVLMIVGFLTLWVWAWSSKRKPDFDKMSRLPLEDDIEQQQEKERGES